jgi:transposase-like protein
MPAPKPPRGAKATQTLNGVKMSKLKFDRILAFRAQLPQLDQKERLGSLDIAARLGVSSSCVNQWLRILGYRLNNHNGRTIYKHDHTGWEEKILPVYKATGYKAGKTAEALGMDKSVVYRWLANTGHLKPTYAPRDISTYKFQNYR